MRSRRFARQRGHQLRVQPQPRRVLAKTLIRLPGPIAGPYPLNHRKASMKSLFSKCLILGAFAFAFTLMPMLCFAQSSDNAVRMNQIQVIGTHNSYHVGIAPSDTKIWEINHPDDLKKLGYRHPSLTAQLTGGVRQLELDVFSDQNGGLYANPAGP